MGTSGRRQRTAATLATAAVVLAACGGDVAPPTEDGPPVVVADPVPFDDTLSPEPSPDPSQEPSPAAEESAEVEGDGEGAAGEEADGAAADASVQGEPGPTSADAAAFVSGGSFSGLVGVQHVVADIDGDSWAEVVVTGVQGRRGVLEIAWWTGDAYEVLATDEGGRGRDVTDLRAADVNRDGLVEVLITVEGDGLQSLSVWQVSAPGGLERLEAVGGCHDGSHVYGVTTARLQDAGDAPPVIVADCDESPLPVADWSEERWVWQDGAYRHASSGEDDSDEDDDDRPGNGNGRDDGGSDSGSGDD